MKSTESLTLSGAKVYAISGPLFFGTMTYFIEQFHFTENTEQIVIDLSRSHVWDHSAVAAISKVVSKYRQLGKHVSIEGLNKESQSLVDRIGLSVPSGHEKAWELRNLRTRDRKKHSAHVSVCRNAFFTFLHVFLGTMILVICYNGRG